MYDVLQGLLGSANGENPDRASVEEQIKQFRLVAGLLTSKVKNIFNSYFNFKVSTLGR